MMPLTNVQLRETEYDIQEIAQGFGIEGRLIRGGGFGNGHINSTIAATFQHQDGTQDSYIFQRINTFVFEEPEKLMRNIQRVIDHLKQKIDADDLPDTERRRLRLLLTPEENPLWYDEEGLPWRGYDFIEQSTSHDVVSSEEQAFEAARTFGQFTRLLADLPSEQVVETIPNFHHTPSRLEQLKQAIAQDAVGRLKNCQAEVDFALSREEICAQLIQLNQAGEIPTRITHNDTKLGNVLLDNKTGQGLCVVDLDTVMPGLSLYDFGDLARTCLSPTPEDEINLEKVCVRPSFFEALARGYSEGVGSALTDAEQQNLAFAARLITLECGIRFLTDHLNGDVYFPVKHDNHNLDRARNQFALVAAIEEQEQDLQALADQIFAEQASKSAR